VINSVKNNSKALEMTPCKTEPYKNSFFVKSMIHWNQLVKTKTSLLNVEIVGLGFNATFNNISVIMRR
jgi:hypothetical protein